MNIRQIETPVTIHSTGSKIGIIDDAKRFVLRQTVNSYSPERFFQLDADLKEIVTALNALATATAKIEALEAKLATAERLLAESTVIEGKGWSISNNGNPAKLITLRQYDGEDELLSYTHHNSILEAFEALEPKENTDA